MKHFNATLILTISLILLIACSPAQDSNAELQSDGNSLEQRYPVMTPELLREIIEQIDSDVRIDANTLAFAAAGQEVAVIFDRQADRMRIMVPVISTDELESKEYKRLLQANFDSALDARYAIAQKTLWATFIHPLSSLSENEFLLGLAQTVNVAKNFRGSYSSGMFTFGAGDSAQIERDKLLDLLRKETT